MHAQLRQVMRVSEVGFWGPGKHMAHLKRITTTELPPVTVSSSKESPNLDLYETSLTFSELAMDSYFLKYFVDHTALIIGLGSVCGPLVHNL